jgi:hypothetical protein
MIAPSEPIAAAPRPATLGDIETRCAKYEDESTTLEAMIAELETDLEAVKNKHLRALKRQASVVAGCEAELIGAVETSPGLFVKPRTLTLHGVKVGLTTSVGKVAFDDEETVVKLVKKMFDSVAPDYIHTSEVPNKDALRTLDPKLLNKLGCRIDGAGDVVLVKRTAGDVEKLLTKLKDKLVEAMVSES